MAGAGLGEFEWSEVNHSEWALKFLRAGLLSLCGKAGSRNISVTNIAQLQIEVSSD